MRKKYTKSLGLFRFLFVGGLSLILLIIINSTSDYYLAKGILALPFMFFLPGYSLVKILFEKRSEIPEILVMSIGISISLFILIAMCVHFTGTRISVENILNPVVITSLILAILYLFRNVLSTKRPHKVGI